MRFSALETSAKLYIFFELPSAVTKKVLKNCQIDLTKWHKVPKMYFYATNMQFLVRMKLVFLVLRLHYVISFGLVTVRKRQNSGKNRGLCVRKWGCRNIISDLGVFIINLRNTKSNLGSMISKLRKARLFLSLFLLNQWFTGWDSGVKRQLTL